MHASNTTLREPSMLRIALVLITLSLFGATTNTPVCAADEKARYGYLGDGIIQEGDDATAELARAAQNPVADMISLPFQNNTNFNFGPQEKTQNVLNIQPVIPFDLSQDWLMITRTVLPVISQPEFTPNGNREFGLGDTVFTAFFSPKNRNWWLGDWLWGAGPAVLVPTSTDDRLGPGEWGIGPSAVFLTMPGRWVIGSLFNNIWSISADSDQTKVNLFTWQPFINYNLDGGWYLVSSPVITANWEADSDNTWTIPIGGGFGRIFRIGKQPVNLALQGFYNIEKPDNIGPEWSIRLSFQLLFPKRR
jgi:hypothetical protein